MPEQAGHKNITFSFIKPLRACLNFPIKRFSFLSELKTESQYKRIIFSMQSSYFRSQARTRNRRKR